MAVVRSSTLKLFEERDAKAGESLRVVRQCERQQAMLGAQIRDIQLLIDTRVKDILRGMVRFSVLNVKPQHPVSQH